MLLAVSHSHQGHFDSLVSIRKGSCPETAPPYVIHSTNSPNYRSQVESVLKSRLFYSLTLLALKRTCTHFSLPNLSLWKLRGGQAEGWVENYGTIIIHWKCMAHSGQQSSAKPSIPSDLFGSCDDPLGRQVEVTGLWSSSPWEVGMAHPPVCSAAKVSALAARSGISDYSNLR